MTTADIIELLRSNPEWTDRVLFGLPDNKKDAFMQFYGINRKCSTAKVLAERYSRTEATIYQWIGSVSLWLRHPHRIHIIRFLQNEQRRQQRWYYKVWQWIVGHTRRRAI